MIMIMYVRLTQTCNYATVTDTLNVGVLVWSISDQVLEIETNIETI